MGRWLMSNVIFFKIQKSSASLLVRLWYSFSALLSPVWLYTAEKQREQGTRPHLNQCLRQLPWRLPRILTPLPLKDTSNPQRHWIILRHQLTIRRTYQIHPLRIRIRQNLLHPTLERRELHRTHRKKMCINGKRNPKKIISLCLRKRNFCKLVHYQCASV